MKQRIIYICVTAVVRASLVPTNAEVPSRPRIYAKVNISSDITQQQKQNPGITPTSLSTYFNNLYRR
jgi:hypothetical protein